MSINLNTNYVKNFISDKEIASIIPEVQNAFRTLVNGTGAGNDFRGWMDLPVNYDKDEFARIKHAAKKIQSLCDVLIVIGIGGSYLGSRAGIQFVKSQSYNQLSKKNTPDIYFAGNTISPSALSDLLHICEGKDICVNVISKSGTTTEPAIAFRVFKGILEKKYGVDGAKNRIFSTTDRSRGSLKKLSDEMGYETFVIPDDVGGRYSVLTAVGLLPLAVSGINIDALMAGAAEAMAACHNADYDHNDAMKYAAIRNLLYRKGMATEILVTYEPSLQLFCEWWKQLYGESEGKDNKGLYPSSVIFSTDLHSLGQYIQQGVRNIFETVIDVQNAKDSVLIPYDNKNLDGLNYIAGKDLNEVNRTAMKATLMAHTDGGVPNLLLEIPDRTAYTFGCLVYFFEFACGVSGYTLGINPFDQPGVEAYKKNMFALLGKPGYESLKAILETNIH